MNHKASLRFWNCYNALPADIRALADAAFMLLKSDARHPSLHLKRVGDKWSVRIGLHYRALAVESHGNMVWFWIGPHAEYDRMIH
ncbi:MAG TPA: hypothetical protein VH253_01610 [Phycisphaerae bacterium]|nr:hypothetical protein [Phycisphaerae bacterium]